MLSHLCKESIFGTWIQINCSLKGVNSQNCLRNIQSIFYAFLSLCLVSTIFNEVAYLTLKSFFHKALNLF